MAKINNPVILIDPVFAVPHRGGRRKLCATCLTFSKFEYPLSEDIKGMLRSLLYDFGIDDFLHSLPPDKQLRLCDKCHKAIQDMIVFKKHAQKSFSEFMKYWCPNMYNQSTRNKVSAPNNSQIATVTPTNTVDITVPEEVKCEVPDLLDDKTDTESVEYSNIYDSFIDIKEDTNDTDPVNSQSVVFQQNENEAMALRASGNNSMNNYINHNVAVPVNDRFSQNVVPVVNSMVPTPSYEKYSHNFVNNDVTTTNNDKLKQNFVNNNLTVSIQESLSNINQNFVPVVRVPSNEALTNRLTNLNTNTDNGHINNSATHPNDLENTIQGSIVFRRNVLPKNNIARENNRIFKSVNMDTLRVILNNNKVKILKMYNRGNIDFGKGVMFKSPRVCKEANSASQIRVVSGATMRCPSYNIPNPISDAQNVLEGSEVSVSDTEREGESSGNGATIEKDGLLVETKKANSASQIRVISGAPMRCPSSNIPNPSSDAQHVLDGGEISDSDTEREGESSGNGYIIEKDGLLAKKNKANSASQIRVISGTPMRCPSSNIPNPSSDAQNVLDGVEISDSDTEREGESSGNGATIEKDGLLAKKNKLIVRTAGTGQTKWYIKIVSKEDLLKHMEERRRRPDFLKAPYKCVSCVTVFPDESVEEMHKKANHVKESEFTCFACQRTFDNIGALTLHYYVHLVNINVYYCTTCEFESRDLEYVKCHVCPNAGSAHLPRDPKTVKLSQYCSLYYCPKCDYIANKCSSIKVHYENIHLSSEDRPLLQCDECNALYRLKTSLRTHVDTVHRGKRNVKPTEPFFCTLCKKWFSNYRIHMRIKHTPDDELKFRCDECEKKFYTALQLDRHKEHHERLKKGERIYKCDECGRAYYTKNVLRVHIMTCHQTKAPPARDHVCEVCGYAFYTRTLLKGHSAKHSNERPYICSICGDTFKYSAALYTHTKLKHKKKNSAETQEKEKKQKPNIKKMPKETNKKDKGQEKRKKQKGTVKKKV